MTIRHLKLVYLVRPGDDEDPASKQLQEETDHDRQLGEDEWEDESDEGTEELMARAIHYSTSHRGAFN